MKIKFFNISDTKTFIESDDRTQGLVIQQDGGFTAIWNSTDKEEASHRYRAGDFQDAVHFVVRKEEESLAR